MAHGRSQGRGVVNVGVNTPVPQKVVSKRKRTIFFWGGDGCWGASISSVSLVAVSVTKENGGVL